METITTYWFIGLLLSFPAIIYLIMLFNQKYISAREQEIDQIYIDKDILNQLTESEQNTFM